VSDTHWTTTPTPPDADVLADIRAAVDRLKAAPYEPSLYGQWIYVGNGETDAE
jgi:hypothetical protein